MSAWRRWRGARLWVAAGAATVVALLAVAEVAGWPFLRAPLQRALQSGSAAPVRLDGDFHLRLFWRPRLQVEALTVGAAPGIDVPHLVDAREVSLRWRWSDLWRWQRGDKALHLLEAGATELDARLTRLADGRASWQLGSGPSPAEDTPMPSVGRLQVGQAHIEIDDRPLRTRVDIDVRRDDDPEGAAHEARAEGRYEGLPVKLQARARGVLPLVADVEQADAPLVPLRVEGSVGWARVHFDGAAAALSGKTRLDGALRLRARSLASVGAVLGLTLPRTPPFELDGHLQLQQGVWQLKAERAVVGESLLGGDFRYDTRTQPPLLSGQLTGKRLLLADLGPAVGVGGAQPASARRVLPQSDFDLPSLRAMDADVAVAIDRLHFGSPALQPLHAVRARLLLDDGVLHLQALNARIGGGELTGSSQLDGNAERARWRTDLRFARLDLADWIRALRTDAPQTGKDAGPRAYLSGLLSGTVQVAGSGRSTAEILGTLDGRLQARLDNGALSHLVTEFAGLDVAQALGVAVRGDKALALKCARIDLRIQQGVAVPQVAVLDNVDSTVYVTGQIDLRNEQLDLRAVARPKDVSPLSLRTPVRVTGTLAEPQVGIDAKPLLAKAAAAAALAIVAAPAAALLPLVDLGSGDAGDPCAPRAAAAAAAPAASGTR